MDLHTLILAAGKGSRMCSDLPKVLHPVLGMPLLEHVIRTAQEVSNEPIHVVVGHGSEAVRKSCSHLNSLTFVEQTEQLGTGHAVLSAKDHFQGVKGSLLVLSGDVITLRSQTLRSLVNLHKSNNAACTLLSTNLARPKGYGRIIRENQGVSAIVEEVDCTENQRSITEINSGIYCFDLAHLFSTLEKVQPKNAQGEYYITDVVSLLIQQDYVVNALCLEDEKEVLGINDRLALAQVETVMQKRINEEWMRRGVSLQKPESIFIDPLSKLDADTYIESGAFLFNSTVGKGSRIESNSRLINTQVAEGVLIKQGSYLESSEVGSHCVLGPYAHLRPGSKLHADVKIGNFVEIKKSEFMQGAKASHLSYIGDAEIGIDVNLGCGFVTCNYDGTRKHKTVIEDGVFVGSDSQVVAPVRIGKDSYVASGSTVTEDAPAESLVISRGKQVTKLGYAKELRKKLKGDSPCVES